MSSSRSFSCFSAYSGEYFVIVYLAADSSLDCSVSFLLFLDHHDILLLTLKSIAQRLNGSGTVSLTILI